MALLLKLMGSTLFLLSLSPVRKGKKKEEKQQLHKLSGELGTCRERQPSVSLPLCCVIHMALACTLPSSREGNRGSAEAAQFSLPAEPRRSTALQGGGREGIMRLAEDARLPTKGPLRRSSLNELKFPARRPGEAGPEECDRREGAGSRQPPGTRRAHVRGPRRGRSRPERGPGAPGAGPPRGSLQPRLVGAGLG